MNKFFTFLLISSISLLSTVLASSLTPIENKDYKILDPAVPVLTDSPNKIQVLAFFWYGCPHCHDLEPLLETWIKKQSPDKVFIQRIPVAFNERLSGHSRLYYTLEALGRLDLHEKFFRTFHIENRHLIKDSEITDWAVSQGLDRSQFTNIFKSFSISNKIQAANKIASDYRLDGVPAIAIQGIYFTSPAIAGSNEKTIEIIDWLVDQAAIQTKNKKKNKR